MVADRACAEWWGAQPQARREPANPSIQTNPNAIAAFLRPLTAAETPRETRSTSTHEYTVQKEGECPLLLPLMLCRLTFDRIVQPSKSIPIRDYFFYSERSIILFVRRLGVRLLDTGIYCLYKSREREMMDFRMGKY